MAEGHPDLFEYAFAYRKEKDNVIFKLINKTTCLASDEAYNTIFVDLVKEGAATANCRKAERPQGAVAIRLS